MQSKGIIVSTNPLSVHGAQEKCNKIYLFLMEAPSRWKIGKEPLATFALQYLCFPLKSGLELINILRNRNKYHTEIHAH